jgi:hypothetical protein
MVRRARLSRSARVSRGSLDLALFIITFEQRCCFEIRVAFGRLASERLRASDMTYSFLRNFWAQVCPRIALTVCRLFRQTASMAVEIDDKLRSNSS